MRKLPMIAKIGVVAVAATGVAVGLTVGAGASAQTQVPGAVAAATDTPTGPYPVTVETDASLDHHTIYRPTTLPSTEKLPVIVWGNGGCWGNGTMFQSFLSQITSYGFLLISSGTPKGSGETQSAWLTQAIDWAVAQNTQADSKYYGKLDTTHIAAMGQSCGGLEVYDVAGDPRITAYGIFNSGILSAANRAPKLSKLHAPIVYFIGGSSDIAYKNANADWAALPATLPAWRGDYKNVGHLATYTQENGGAFAEAATYWVQWQLKGDPAAKAQFVGPDGGGLSKVGWKVQTKNLS